MSHKYIKIFNKGNEQQISHVLQDVLYYKFAMPEMVIVFIMYSINIHDYLCLLQIILILYIEESELLKNKKCIVTGHSLQHQCTRTCTLRQPKP